MVLKKVSFIIAIIGISFLIFLLARPPTYIESLKDVKINQKVSIQGTVQSERDLDNFKILEINNTEIVCSCSGNYLHKVVRVIGIVEEYQSKKQVRALEIKVLSN